PPPHVEPGHRGAGGQGPDGCRGRRARPGHGAKGTAGAARVRCAAPPVPVPCCMAGTDTMSAALERVMARFGRMLRSVGRQRGLSEADLDELTQEVRVRLWRALAEREKIERVRSSYVYRAALSAALDMVRRRRRLPEEP